MNQSRAKNSVLILATSSVRMVTGILMNFISQTVFIYVLGAEYLGLNGLFSNILSLLSMSELGIGVAISFYLYRPLVDNNIERIKSLMHFYKICYRVVGFLIMAIGICIMPILPKIVNFDQAVPENLYFVYFLYLVNTASSYFLSAYKQTLVTANQELYKIEKINTFFLVINCIVDVCVLIICRSYIMYLVMKIVLICLKNIVLGKRIDKEYTYLKDINYSPLSREEIKLFFSDIGDVALFQIGSTLFNATDNIIISIMLGTVVVGYYSNYYLLISQCVVVIGIVVKAFSAGIGNVIATESKEKQFLVYRQLDFVTYVVVATITAGLFQGLNSVIKIWTGRVDENYVLSQIVVLFLCASFFMDGTTQILNKFREGSGTFKTGRSLQIMGGVLNIFLSVVLGNIFALEGIFAATVISKMFITLIPFLIKVGKSVFGKGKFEMLQRYSLNVIILACSMLISWYISRPFHMKGVVGFIAECVIAVITVNLCIFIVYFKRPEYEFVLDKVKAILKKKI